MSTTRLRSFGAGAPYIEEKYNNLHEVFGVLMDKHQAGSPMNETRRTYLSLRGIVAAFAERGITISTFMVQRLLGLHRYGLRKQLKCATIKEDKDRDAQFKQIAFFREMAQNNAQILAISVDTKKKEQLGHLARQGTVHCQESLEVFDHDFEFLSTGRIVPYGIYELANNSCHLVLGNSADTSDFAIDAMKNWWDSVKQTYKDIQEIYLFCDGGGSNRAAGYRYKVAIQELANYTQKTIRICHYPPYCSKYNPIEHRAFPHITRALSGVVLDSATTAQLLIEKKATTKTGFKTVVSILDKTYQIGKKVTKEAIEALKMLKDEVLGKWNYVIMPNTLE